MTHTTVLIIMDAGRSDYVRPDSMPFLNGLASGATRGALEAPAGFAQRTVLFTGRYPDASNNFSAFAFDPANSPFRWVRRLGPLGRLVQPRRVLYPARVGIAKVTRWVTKGLPADPAWIPTRFLPFFRPSEDVRRADQAGALGSPSIFDLCRTHGRRFRYLAASEPGDDRSVFEGLVRHLRATDPYDLYVARVSATQQMGHTHGPFSKAMQESYLRALDQKLASIHAALVGGYDSWDLFVVGDHGMAPVQRRVNVLGSLSRLGLKAGKNYVVLVNSTLTVLWYLTDKGRQAIEALLPRIEGAHMVEPEERKRLRIPEDRRWGDRILAAEPGVLFWPDFFHVTDSKLEGMHGYLDKTLETHGAAILASSDGDAAPRAIGVRPMVDVFPTLCDLLGLPVPKGLEGTSIVRIARAHARPAKAKPRGPAQTRAVVLDA